MNKMFNFQYFSVILKVIYTVIYRVGDYRFEIHFPKFKIVDPFRTNVFIDSVKIGTSDILKTSFSLIGNLEMNSLRLL